MHTYTEYDKKNKVFFGDMRLEKYTSAVRECREHGARCERPNRLSPENLFSGGA